ncbi:hypothetical protein AB1L30_24020 [Bremerella sp. JC817]|uniref:hypothetical protein n=1 Tax=Bremerella sp. JC817 TaxID=3231756 RepID=UPI00345758C7
MHRTMPTVSQVKTFDLQGLADARSKCPIRISWSIAVLRAYALLSAETASLRQTFMEWPWPHLYEHPHPIGNLAISRVVDGEQWLFFAPMDEAHTMPLLQLQGLLERYQTAPVETAFKNQVRFANYPDMLRRVMWWLRFHFTPKKRVKRLGTFALTTLAGQGVTIVDPKAPVTTTLTYGPLDDQGRCNVTIAYDHRVMDGKEVADILCALERKLQTQILSEFEMLTQQVESRSRAA